MIKKHQPQKIDQLRQSTVIDQNNQNLILQQLQQFIQIKTTSNLVTKRSHHSSCITKNQIMYVYGGYQAGGAGIINDFLTFDLANKKWELISKNNLPGARHSHTVIHYSNKLILFGGVISTLQSTNTLFEYDLATDTWTQIKFQENQLQPPQINSHHAIVYQNQMIVIGGQNLDKYNDKIYCLNLQSKKWRIVENVNLNGYQQRIDCSVNLYKDSLYIFGGKIDLKIINQLWQYNIKQRLFNKVIVKAGEYEPYERIGHSAAVFNEYLCIFGGSSGVIHQRNDLVFYNFTQNVWIKHWSDHSQKLKPVPPSNRQSVAKKSRSNSVKKFGASGINKSNSICSNHERFFNQSQQQSKLNQNERKYRRKMKNDNYYNENYPFYGQKQFLSKNKHKKNDLLVDIEKQAKQEKKKIPLNFSQTFESLNHTILGSISNNSNLCINGSFVDERLGVPKEEKKEEKQTSGMKNPKPRDGHSCEMLNDKMLIFGGDRHHMSFNDLIMIDLKKILPRFNQ